MNYFDVTNGGIFLEDDEDIISCMRWSMTFADAMYLGDILTEETRSGVPYYRQCYSVRRVHYYSPNISHFYIYIPEFLMNGRELFTAPNWGAAKKTLHKLEALGRLKVHRSDEEQAEFEKWVLSPLREELKTRESWKTDTADAFLASMRANV